MCFNLTLDLASCLLQALNPDPTDISEDDDEEHMYEDAEDEGVYDIGGGGDNGDAGINFTMCSSIFKS